VSVDYKFQETAFGYYILGRFPETRQTSLYLDDVSRRFCVGRLNTAKIRLNKQNYMELLKALYITISHYLCSFPYLSCLCSHESVLYTEAINTSAAPWRGGQLHYSANGNGSPGVVSPQHGSVDMSHSHPCIHSPCTKRKQNVDLWDQTVVCSRIGPPFKFRTTKFSKTFVVFSF
jgi:hypothetical protein